MRASLAVRYVLWVGVALLWSASLALACDTCACTFNAKEGGSSTLITPTAATLGRGRGSVGVLFEHQRYHAIPAGDAHALHHRGHDVHGKDHEEFYSLSLGYGVLENLDLYVTAPIVSKTSIEVHEHDTLGQKNAATGFGDLRLVGKYRFWRQGADAALLLGVKAPTGDTSEENPSSEEFEPELQPGSGSWDLMSGLAVSRRVTSHAALASSIQYTHRGEGAKEGKFGDLFHLNVGGSYALRPLGRVPNVSVVLELRTEWALRDRSRDSDTVLDSGGTTVLLSPGLSAELTKDLSAFWAMPVPIYQNLGGQHEELRYEVLTGLSWHF